MTSYVSDDEASRRAHGLAPEEQRTGRPCLFCAGTGVAVDQPSLAASKKRLSEETTANDLKRILYGGSRRRNHLVRMIEDSEARSRKSHDYDRLELAFVEAGLEALHFWERHGATAEDAIAMLKRIAASELDVDGEDADEAQDIIDRFDGV